MLKVLSILILCCIAAWTHSKPLNSYQVERALLQVPHDSDQSLDTAMKKSQWQTVEQFGNHGFSSDTFWLKLRFTHIQQDQELIARLVYPIHDNVDFFVVRKRTEMRHYKMGDTVLNGNWQLANKTFSLPLSLKTNEDVTLYIRVTGINSKVLQVTLDNPKSFSESSQLSHVLAGALYGILLIMGLYNLSLAFLIRDRAYFTYVVYVACFAFFALSVTGDGFYYLWSSYPKFNHYAIAIAGGVLIIPTMLFPYFLLDVNKNTPILKPIYFGYIVLAIIYLLSLSWLDGNSALKIINILSISATPFLLAAGMYSIYKKVPVAKIYTVAWFVLMVGLAVLSLSAYNVLPSNEITRNANIIGGILEMVLLSIALAQRIHSERKAKLIALNKMQKAEEAMLDHQRMSQELFESAPVGIFRLNKAGQISAANPAFCELMGQPNATYETLNQANVQECFADKDALRDEIFEEQTIIDRETTMTTLDGKQRTCSITLRVKKQANDVFIQGYLTDISERKQAQHIQEIMEKARMASLEQLVTGVAHEINTPLGVNITSLSCVSDDLNHIDTQMSNGSLTKDLFTRFVKDSQGALKLMSENLTRISNLVSRFKLVSVQHLGTKKEKLALKAYAKEILMVHLAGHDNIEAKVNTHNCEIVSTYPAALNIIIDQLIENSLLHGLEKDQSGNLSLDFEESDGQLTITYRDSGKGVSDDIRNKIFDPFVTTRRGSIENAGLGMYRIYNLVKQVLKGDIELLNESGFAIKITFKL